MRKKLKENTLPLNIQVLDRDAIVLIVERAKREHRSYSNAAAVTVFEALGSKPDNLMANGTENDKNVQA